MARASPARRTTTSARYPDDPTSQYAADVVAGKVVAGELLIASAERHLKDLVDGPARGLHWRPERARHAIEFPPAVLSITAGTYAGRPFNLLPHLLFCTGSLFGWRLASGRLRFRSAWIETGKGQAKSPWMAATGLYMGGFYGVKRAEVYSIGQDRKTANVLFQDAVAMCRASIPGSEDDEDDTLETRGEVLIRGELTNAWKIEFTSTGGIFQSLANGEAVSGPRPILVAADEIHEFKNNHSIETWRAAVAKMPGDALMLLGTNTPASTQIVGTEYSEFYQRVALGEHDDDEAFAFIARVDKADWPNVFTDESCWPKALPALGITFPVENVRGAVKTAQVLLSTAMSTKRLYMGVPLGTVDFWIAEEAWASAQGVVDPGAMKGLKCWLSLDLSKKNDLTALTAVWIDDGGHLFVKTWYWTTREGLKDRARADQTPYDQWVEKGFIMPVPGAVIDKTFVAAQVKTLCAEHEVEFLAFDPAGMADFIAACEDIGFDVWKFEGTDKPQGIGLKLVNHAQGPRVRFEDRQLTMPRSIERLEDRILEGTITIDNSPVTYSCAGNAMIVSDGQENRAFDKKRSRGRIDGMVTTAMGVGAADNELGIRKFDAEAMIG